MPRPSVGGYSSETFIGNELRSFCFLLDKKLYHCISAAPQVNPAPNPASKIKSFSLIFPSLFTLSKSIGTVAAAVFQHVSRFTGILSIGIFFLFDIEVKILKFA